MRKSATELKSLTSVLNSSNLKRNGGQEQLPKLNTSGRLSGKKLNILEREKWTHNSSLLSAKADKIGCTLKIMHDKIVIKKQIYLSFA